MSRPRGSRAPYAEERAAVVEQAYRVLRAAGLQHEIANKEIAAAAGFKHSDSVDQVRRESPATYCVTEVRAHLKSADVATYLAGLRKFFKAHHDNSRAKRAGVKWANNRDSGAAFRRYRKALSPQGM